MDKIELEEIRAKKKAADKRAEDFLRRMLSLESEVKELKFKNLRKDESIREINVQMNKNNSFLESTLNAKKDKDKFIGFTNKIDGTVQEAALNFSTMVSSTTVKAFDLNNRFGEQASNGKSEIEGIFQDIDNLKSSIEGKITGLKGEIHKLNMEKEENEHKIRLKNNQIEELSREKSKALCESEYYEKLCNKYEIL